MNQGDADWSDAFDVTPEHSLKKHNGLLNPVRVEQAVFVPSGESRL